MNTSYNTYRPSGFHTMNSYLMVPNPEELIDFLKNAFYAEEKLRTVNSDDGSITNSILQIGDSCFMVAQSRDPYLDMRSSFYLYVEDVDAMHQNAMKYGAKLEFEPEDMSYGDRQSGVIDPSGNYWWISKRLVEEDYKY